VDRLPLQLLDGYRYASSQEFKEQILSGAQKTGGDAEAPPKKVRKLQEVYLVNKRKFHSSATEGELVQELSTLTEDGHRIIQCKIR
jgi:hypothetical protein